MTPPSAKPLPYTANPLLLILNDLWLFVQITFTWPITAGLPSIILPIGPTRSNDLDELALTVPNAWASLVHIFLVVGQTAFLISLFPLAYVLLPSLYFLYIVAFVLGNQWFTVLLNGRRRTGFQSHPQCVEGKRVYEHERWVFINGVAVGEHWLQSNLNRLAMTFRRPVYGIHNQTRGIIFDVLECIIQRDLAYPTLDIRQAYAELLIIISDPKVHKVVLIVHSQGAIEGGMVLDWLYATVAAEQIRKLEVYTFGNAANHWNAPVITTVRLDPGRDGAGASTSTNSGNLDSIVNGNGDDDGDTGDTIADGNFGQNGRVVKYIEHYANTGDYVSRFGILHFRPQSARQPQQWTRSVIPGAPGATLESADDGPVSSTAGHDKAADVAPSRKLRLTTRHATSVRSQDNMLSPTTPMEKVDLDVENDNKYVGRLFKRLGSGHQLNQHYLDNFFEMEGIDTKDLNQGRVKDGNVFMDAQVDLDVFEEWDTVQVVGDGTGQEPGQAQDDSRVATRHGQGQGGASAILSQPRRKQVKELSRLWEYRNGGDPDAPRPRSL